MTTSFASDAPLPYPTARSGGLFLLLIGLTVVAATLAGGGHGLHPGLFIVGAMLAVAIGLVILRRRLSAGEQTHTQRFAVIGALLLEAAMVLAVVHWVGTDSPRTLWLWILLTVGVHFLPFGLVHGPKTAVLGLLCITNALLGLWLGPVPFVVFGLVDGLLKVGVGGLLLWERPRLSTPYRTLTPLTR